MRSAWVGVVVIVCSVSPRRAGAERLTLSEVLSRAGEFPTVVAAGHEVAAARALTDEVGRWIPPIELTFGAQPIASIECEPGPDACTATNRDDIGFGVDGAALRVDARTVIPLYTFGKRSAGVRAADAGVRAAEARRDATRGDVELDAARAYFGLKLARALAALVDEGLAYLDDERGRIDRHLAEQTGEATETDRLRLETARAEIAYRRAEITRAEREALAAVRALVGDEAADIDDAPLSVVALPNVPGGAGAPELRLAAAGVEAYAALAAVERSQLWPTLVLVGEASYARAPAADDPASAFAYDPLNRGAVSAQIALHWTFDLGLDLARRRGAEARAAMAVEMADAAERGVSLAAESAAAAIDEARDRLTAAEAGQESARQWLVAHQQAADLGLAEPDELGDALRAYFEMGARRLQAVYDLNIAALEAARAAGAELVELVVP